MKESKANNASTATSTNNNTEEVDNTITTTTATTTTTTTTTTTNDDDIKKSLDESHWSEKKQAIRIHAEAIDALTVLKKNHIIWDILSPQHQTTISAVIRFFCPLLERFFESQEKMDSQRLLKLKFTPATMISLSSNSSSTISFMSDFAYITLNQSINEILPSLWPSDDFFINRENVRCRIQSLLLASGIIPNGTEIGIFGSSRNNFGSDGADLDMCLIIPNNNNNINSMNLDRAQMIEKIGEYLQSKEIGMLNVQIRSTARIPIVIFTDSISGNIYIYIYFYIQYNVYNFNFI
jgi:hypothetical protein